MSGCCYMTDNKNQKLKRGINQAIANIEMEGIYVNEDYINQILAEYNLHNYEKSLVLKRNDKNDRRTKNIFR